MAAKKKILLISHSNSLGGAELCFIETIKALQLKQYEIHAVFPSIKGELKSICEPLCKSSSTQYLPSWIEEGEKYPLNTKFKLLINIIVSIRKSIKLINQIKPDIIITNTSVMPQYGIAAKLTHKKHIWFIHELVDEDFGCHFIFGKNLSKKTISYCSETIITNSNFVNRRYILFVKKEKLKMLYQPVEITFPIEDITKKSNNRLSLLIIGKVSEFKGQREAILACKELNKQGIDFNLLIVGAQPSTYLDELKSLVIEDLTDKVEFIPFTSTPSIYYQQSDIVLVCSRCEALGRITIEAMKMGLPVIASNQGGNLELIQNGINGYTYELGKPIDLANKIILLKNIDIRKKMGDNGRRFANENFNFELYTKELNNILINL